MGQALTHRRGGPGAELTGTQKVAVLLMALGEEASSQVTRSLPPEDVETISFEIARLGRVEPTVVNAVLKEWQETERAAFSLAEGGTDYAKRILVKAFGEQKASQIFKRIEAQLSQTLILGPLQRADARQIAAFIRNEHPQTMALVLAYLPSRQTSDVLREIPSELGSEILLRMARMEKVLPDVLQVVERILGADTKVTFQGSTLTTGGPEAVASVLNELSGSLEKELLDGLARQDQELSRQIKELMFVFEDIVRLDDDTITRILREVENRTIALALKVASEELKERILGGLTARARGALLEEMEFLGPVRMREVEEAQSEVVSTIRAMEEAGQITISGGDDVMVA